LASNIVSLDNLVKINQESLSSIMENIRPIKRFGQNYLVDRNILLKIVQEINPSPDDKIVEIGPGHGALTSEIIKYAPDLTLVEIDNRVIDELKFRFPDILIINNDFLKIDLRNLYHSKGKTLRIVGNIPYNITSPIIFKMIGNKEFIKDSVLMIQYEVAKRLIADKRTKDYGILAVILNYFADVKLCFKVSPNVFYPKPKVHSAVIHLNFREPAEPVADTNLFIKVVKAAFGNRRKTLKNSINNSIFGELDFDGCDIDFSKRAEELSLTDFLHLTNFIHGRQ